MNHQHHKQGKIVNRLGVSFTAETLEQLAYVQAQLQGSLGIPTTRSRIIGAAVEAYHARLKAAEDALNDEG